MEILDRDEKKIPELKKIIEKIIEIYAIIVVWSFTILIFLFSIFGGNFSIEIHFENGKKIINSIINFFN